MPMVIAELEQTCGACPSQWEGALTDGRAVYIRYRFSRLSWGVGPTVDDAVDDSSNHIRDLRRGEYDGWLDQAELPELLQPFLAFPTPVAQAR